MALIENSNYLVKEIPRFNPVIDYYEYREWWAEQKRRCIEGYWVGGKWMSGPLYYYVNFHTIKFEDKSVAARKPGRPWLRDIDWVLFNIYEEARGFSGWQQVNKTQNGTKQLVNYLVDKQGKFITADRGYGEESTRAIILKELTEEDIAKAKYIKARDLLTMENLVGGGKAQYINEAKNVFSMQSRGGGKSFSISGMIDHNFLFDGALDYDSYLENKMSGTPLASDTLVGAIDTKYTTPLLAKIKLGLSELPGATTFAGITYPSPLAVSMFGSWGSGKTIYATNSKSEINHRTFNDNPLAANGTRPNLAVLDEIGFLNNILEVLPALESTQTSSDFKRLVIFALGTGGLVRGKALTYAEEVFYNPEAYNALVFEDEWEGRGKIGYFVPNHKTLNKYKEGPNMITNVELAKKEVKFRIAQADKAKDKRRGVGERINRPEKPSDCFYSVEGNYFQSVASELKQRMSTVLADSARYLDSAFTGELVVEQGILSWKDIQDAAPIHEFPVSKYSDKEGCIVLYEKPQRVNNIIPFGTYIGGIDTVDKAASTTDSLFCIVIMNRFTRRIVAEYFGRSRNPADNYEKARRLLQFYNATAMYEQNLTGLYTHFEQRQSLHLLADTPQHLRNPSTFIEGTNTSKGINATTRVNSDGRKMIITWLLEHIDSLKEKIVIDELRSIGIIRELLAWQPDGNYDRVSALIMLMWYDNTLYRQTEVDFQEKAKLSKKRNSYWERMGVLKKEGDNNTLSTIPTPGATNNNTTKIAYMRTGFNGPRKKWDDMSYEDREEIQKLLSEGRFDEVENYVVRD